MVDRIILQDKFNNIESEMRMWLPELCQELLWMQNGSYSPRSLLDRFIAEYIEAGASSAVARSLVYSQVKNFAVQAIARQ